MRQSIWPIVLTVVLAGAISGCTTVPVGKYKALKSSTDEVVAKTSETYARIAKLQRAYVVTTAPNQPITADSFKPVTKEGASYDLRPELKIREDALEVLDKYTTVLASLAARDFQPDIDKASLDLTGSVQKLSESASSSSTISRAAGTFADVAARAAVEHRRKKALRSIMDQAQGSIDELCSLIVGSNKSFRDYLGIVRMGMINHANVARPPYATSDRYFYDFAIADQISELEEVHQGLDVTDQAMTKYPAAHREIRELLDKKGTKIDALKALVKEAQRANKLYKSLK